MVKYAAFGRVIEGMDVVNEIATTATDRADKPKTPQVMKNVTVETFGKDYSDVEKNVIYFRNITLNKLFTI